MKLRESFLLRAIQECENAGGAGYFPQAMSRLGPDVLVAHRLRREIIATTVANALVNRVGASFIEDTKARTARDAGSISRAYLIVADVFGLEAVWESVEALDNQVPAAAQTQLLLAVATVVDQAVRWFLLSVSSVASVAHFLSGS